MFSEIQPNRRYHVGLPPSHCPRDPQCNNPALRSSLNRESRPRDIEIRRQLNVLPLHDPRQDQYREGSFTLHGFRVLDVRTMTFFGVTLHVNYSLRLQLTTGFRCSEVTSQRTTANLRRIHNFDSQLGTSFRFEPTSKVHSA